MLREKVPAVGVVILGLVTLFASANAARPVEGYRSADKRVGCVMYQAFNADGNAVKCGRRGLSRGLLLTGAGAARRATWRWPAKQLGSLFFRARSGRTLYLVGGTAKVDGDESTLRCTFTRSSVRCLNGSGDGDLGEPRRHPAYSRLTRSDRSAPGAETRHRCVTRVVTRNVIAATERASGATRRRGRPGSRSC